MHTETNPEIVDLPNYCTVLNASHDKDGWFVRVGSPERFATGLADTLYAAIADALQDLVDFP